MKALRFFETLGSTHPTTASYPRRNESSNGNSLAVCICKLCFELFCMIFVNWPQCEKVVLMKMFLAPTHFVFFTYFSVQCVRCNILDGVILANVLALAFEFQVTVRWFFHAAPPLCKRCHSQKCVVIMADTLLVNTAFCDVLCPFCTACNWRHILRQSRLGKASLTVLAF